MANPFDQFDAAPSAAPAGNPFDQFDAPSPVGDGARSALEPMTFTGAMSRGVDQAQGMGFGAIEAAGEATGIESVRRVGQEGRERNVKEAEQYGTRSKAADIRGVGDFGQWAKETAGEQIPMMAGPMAGGIAGAGAGFMVGGPIGATIGGVLGAFVPSLILGTGEVQSKIKEKDPEAQSPGWAFAGGSAIAALDSILPGKVGGALVRRFGMEAAEEIAKKSLTRSIAGAAAKDAPLEALTEAVQEAIGEFAGAYGADKPIDWQGLPGEMFEAGAGGLLLGGATGGVRGAAERGGRGVAQPEIQPGDVTPAGAVPADTLMPEPAPEPAYTPNVSPPVPAPGTSPLEEAWQGAPNAVEPTPGASPFEQAIQRPSADVSTGGVTAPSPQPQEAVAPAPGLASNAASTTDSPIEQLLSGTGDQRHEVASDLPPGQHPAPQQSGVDPNLNGASPQGDGTRMPLPEPEPEGQITGRPTLQKLLDDPRTVDELRADMQAAENWAATDDWQVVPPGVEIDGLDVRTAAGQTQARIAPPAGSREAPVQLDSPEAVHVGAEQTAQPTPAQAEAGNYKKRHLKWQGLDISIETEQGAERVGIGADGKPWSAIAPVPYGHVLGTKGADGDPLDISIGPNPNAKSVFVIDQVDPDSRKFDETKSFQGMDSADQAQAAYDASFSDGSGAFRSGAITEMSVAQWKSWAKNGDHKKPVAYTPPRAAAKPKSKILSLFEFLASIGGIKDPGGDLRAMGLDRAFVPGFGRLVRANGKDLDMAREAAVEAGYLSDESARAGGLSTSTINDLLEALDQEARGQKVYSQHDEQAAAERESERYYRAENERLDAAKVEVRDLAKSEGINLTDKEIDEAAEFALVNGYDLIDAIVEIGERSAYSQHDEMVVSESPQEQPDEQPAENVAAGAGADGAGPAPPRQQPTRPDARPAEGSAPRVEQPGEAERAGSEARPVEAAPPVDLKVNKPVSVTALRDYARSVVGDDVRSVHLIGSTAAKRQGNDIDLLYDLGDRAIMAGDGAADMVEQIIERIPTIDTESYDSFFKVGDRYFHLSSGAGRAIIENTSYAKEQEGKPSVILAEAVPRPAPSETPQPPSGAKPSTPIDDRAPAKPGPSDSGPVVVQQAETVKGVPLPPAIKPRSEKPEAPTKVAPEPVTRDAEAGPLSNLPALDLANDLLERLRSGKPITAKILQSMASEIYGTKLAEGQFNRKDMQDALELAVNLYIKETRHLRVDSPNPQHAIKMLSDVLDGLPTQRVRSEEQESFQQFSTPPNYAAAAVYAANVKSGDVLLEPSAGTGSIVAAASAPGVTTVANELSERRIALLRRLVGSDGRVFNENAEQIDNILPDDVKPTVVVMNPPFSQTAGRMGTQKVPMVAAEHIEAALNLLQDGGRLVAIVGRGMTMGAPTYRAWWSKIGKEYAVRANVGVDGKVYEKYGTTFGTRLIVIDKVEPESGHKPVLADVQTVDDLLRALEPIRDGRSEPQTAGAGAEQPASEPGSPQLADEGAGAGQAAALPISTQPGGVGAGERSGGGVAGDGSRGAPVASGQPARVEGGGRNGVAPVKPERSGQGGAGSEPGQRPANGAKPEAGRGAGAKPDLQPAAKPEPGVAASSERAELEAAQAKPGTQGAAEIDESLYQSYEPQRVRVKGAKPHPGPLVESASMSSVAPPNVTYQPHIPAKVIEKGLLSSAQLEPVVYAGQAHGKMLPAAEGEAPKRRGYFIGDGTGVGKGREIAGVILDNWQQGRTKAVWVSEKQTLLHDAKRDWGGLGQDANVIFNAGKVKTGEPIKAGKGIAFITYDTLKGGMSDQEAIARGGLIRKQKVKVNGQSGVVQKVEPGRRGEPAQITVKLDNGTEITEQAHKIVSLENAVPKSRVDQLVEWLGADFDGVIAYDEAHNMGNAVTTKGERGAKDAAAKAIAGIQLQDRLPNARIVYVSATGATEVSNLAYANRLGLWGRGTPFASQAKFVSDVGEGGIAAMELVARDMKQLGLYTARNLSYDGVEYDRVEHTLDTNQREIYDTLAEAWQVVLRNINAALEETGAKKDARAKSAAMSAFWGGHQRFFNQIITSLQMPSVIKAVEKDIEAGRQVVLQLTNTNEASQERAAAKATTAEEIEDLDITPRDQIIQLVEKSFPTQEYEQYMDGDKVKSRPVVDKDGNPVQNKKALAMREALIERLASVRVPQGPLDMVLDHFGAETVAEVTGRGRRFILKTDDKTGERKRVEDTRGGSANLAETDAYQAGKKKVLVFSEAGGTGRSYHADNSAPSKGARRVHYLVQGGWRADKAVQGFGRTHRTNQASAPIFRLVTTDLKGQKRFISSIARRLGQLGALTKGQRQAGDQGVFSARDNLESTEARQALQQFYSALLRDELEGITINAFEEQTGLALRTKDDEGRVTGVKLELPPITTFLNRLLSLKVDLQNRVFDAFSEKLDAVIEARREAGLLDVGLETVKADKIEKNTEKVVHTIEGTDANTKYVKFTLSTRFTPREFDDVAKDKNRPVEFFAKSPRGKVYAVAKATSLTNKDGVIVDYYRLIGPAGSHTIEKKNVDTGKDWSKINRGQAESMWQGEIDKAPEYVTEPLNLITGAILPIWDRLGGSSRVVRLQDDTGEQFIGRVVPQGQIAATLKKLGAETEATKTTPESLFEAMMKGGRATLSNGWVLKRSRVAGENRIELVGPSSFSEANEVKADGIFTERIDYKTRMFIPASETEGPEVLRKLTQYRTVVELSEPGARPTEAAAGDEDGMFSAVPKGWESVGPAPAQDMTEADIAKVREVVQRVAGVDPKFIESITAPATSRAAKAWGLNTEIKGQGAYNPTSDLIYLALDTGGPRAAYHEAFHRLQRRFLNDREIAVLATEADKLRTMLRNDLARRDSADRIAQHEVEAEAFAIYSINKDAGAGLNNVLKRAWNRLRLMLDRLRNVLRGLGYQTAEDIFEKAHSGKTVKRPTKGLGNPGAFEFSEEPGADGKPQLVLPGAEKITDKERAERKAQQPKRSSKPQKTVDGLPLFAGEPDPQNELFSLAEDPATAQQRQRVSQRFLARGQFLDRAIRVPFDIFGAVTRDGAWKPGAKLFQGAANIITGAKFSVEGRFAGLNPYLEAARVGLVDRYGLDPAYVERERGRALDERAVMLQGAEVLKSLKAHKVGTAEARVLQAILTGEDVTDADMGALAEPIRAAVDQLGQEAVSLGMLSGESFERNRGAYLHRVYQKYEAEQNGLVRMVNGIMGSRRKKIIGDQFRGRGMFQEIAVGRLMRDIPEWHEAGRGKPQKGDKFIRLDDMPEQGRLELRDDAGAEKPLRTVYWPADRAIPERYSGFRNQGTFEVRGEKAGKIVIWRDFTKAEREKMGEILDARYTIGKTFMLMAHDLSVGKLYKDIAENEQWTSSQPPAGRTLDAAEWSAQRQRYWKHGDVEWVKVPNVEIPNSGGKKRWGALADRYVREEIWRDLNEQQIMSRPNVWRTLLTQWKLNKTARSPVVHMNNVMSNFVLMDLLDVRWQDLAQGLRSYVSGDAHYEEAFKHGAFGADMMTQEVRDQVLKPVLEELMRSNTFQQGGHLGALGQVSRFTELLWSKAKALDKKMTDLYRVEDELFRMATYIRRRALGDTPKQAADHAREQFIDYDIRAPWVNVARNTVLPFISYTYRAAPLVARAIATRPWKLGKYFLLAYAANAMAYALTGGDEDKERRSLREQEQGHTWIGTERMMRMPFNDQYSNPIFLDVRRWIPAGDVFDLSNGDIPAWLNIGGPLMIGAELFLNRQSFTGQEIFNTKTDDIWDRMSKRGDHLYKSFMPSAAWVPGSWYWEKIANAAKGATDRQGRPYSVPLALSSSVGVKLKPQDVDDGFAFKAMEFRRIERELQTEARRLSSRQDRKMISEAEFNKAMQRIIDKQTRNAEKAAETFKDSGAIAAP